MDKIHRHKIERPYSGTYTQCHAQEQAAQVTYHKVGL